MIRKINCFCLLITILLLLFVSCRENIIAPDNFAGNINEPILISEPNSYTFFINAENITIDVVNNSLFSSTTSRITISIVNYSSGSVSVQVIDPQSISRFNYFGNDDESSYTEALNGFVPQSVGIKTVGFSGKLKVQLTKAL
jgi:hypothetical protein